MQQQIINIIIISLFLLVIILHLIIRSFRLSGLIIFCAFFGLYLANFYIKNLFISFLSFSVFIVFTLFIFYYLFVIIKNKKTNFVSLNYNYLNPMMFNDLHIAAENLPVSFPGIFYMVKFDIYNHDIFIDTASVPVIKEKDRLNFSYKFKNHGDFTVKNIKFILRDIFGFTEFNYSIRSNFKVMVYPYYNDNIKVPFFNNKDGSEVLQSIIRINSTDFFENRKYYPGDDPRKINWKIFAHIKELHVREIEKIPPKIGQIYVIFAPYSDIDIEFEYISSLFVTTADFLLKYGVELKIMSPVSDNEIIINKTNESEFNNIVNSSYKKINIPAGRTIENAIFFGSFYEYARITDSNLIKNSFAAITFFSEDNVKINDPSFLLKINKHDSLIKDLIYKIKTNGRINTRYDLLDIITGLSETNKVKLEIYKTGNEFETKSST